MSQGDSTVVIKTFTLSQKEERLKNKLFANGAATQQKNKQSIQNQPQRQQQQQNRSSSLQPQNQQQQQQSSTQQINPSQQGLNANNNQSQFQQIYSQIPDQKIDQFLKQMENELNNINKKQVSIGMLNSQTQIIKEQNEVLNENQKQLAILMNKINNDDKIVKHKQELVEQNKSILKELLKPINEQIQEIKQIYDKTKLTQKEVYQQMDKSPSQNNPQLNQNLKEFQNANSSLKNKLESANTNLNGLMPENMSAFSNMTNFNIDIYSKTINHLKNQIQELQKDAQKAEQDLEERQEKLNRLPKQQDLLIPIQENVQAQVENIDFISSRQIVNNKLGGEFDYDDYCEQLNEIQSDGEALWREYQQNMNVHSIFIPKVTLTQNELNDLSYKMPSVLDDIKIKLGLDPTKPMKNPNQRIRQRDQQQNYIDMARQEVDPVTNYAKGKSLKPKNLETLKSEPKPCQKEIQFEKRDSQPARNNQFDTLLIDKSDIQQKKVQSSLTHIPDITKPIPYPKISQPSLSQIKYPDKHSNATSMSEIKRKTSGHNFINNNNNNTQNNQNKINQNKRIGMSNIIDRDIEDELKEYDDYENYLQIQMDERIAKNIINPQSDQYNFKKKQIPQEDYVAISLDKNNMGMMNENQQQPAAFDRETLKNIFLEVLHENKQVFFPNLQNNSNQNNQIQEQNEEDSDEILQTNPSVNDDKGRRRLSDIIKKDNQTSPMKTSQINSNNGNQGQKRDSSYSIRDAEAIKNQNVQQQSQDLALNFLQVINSTLAQVNAGINKNQNPNKQQQFGLDIVDGSEGSLEDDSMEAGVQMKRAQQQSGYNNSNFNQQGMFGYGQMPQSRQQQSQPFAMTLNPYQQQQQMMMGQGMGGMNMPMPIYPGMMMPSTWMMPPTVPQMNANNKNSNNNNNNNMELNDTRINLNDYYREFQLSDTDTVVNQSSISMSQYDASKSNRSYADSIFQSQNQSRSDGQVSVPGRQSVSNIKVQNDYYPSQHKYTHSQAELSESHEISQDYSQRRRQRSDSQNKQSKPQESKYVGDDIWNSISDEYSEGQI